MFINQNTGRNGKHLDYVEDEQHHEDEKVFIQDNFDVEITSNNQILSYAEKELPPQEEKMLCLLANDQSSCGVDKNSSEVTIIYIYM